MCPRFSHCELDQELLFSASVVTYCQSSYLHSSSWTNPFSLETSVQMDFRLSSSTWTRTRPWSCWSLLLLKRYLVQYLQWSVEYRPYHPLYSDYSLERSICLNMSSLTRRRMLQPCLSCCKAKLQYSRVPAFTVTYTDLMKSWRQTSSLMELKLVLRSYYS